MNDKKKKQKPLQYYNSPATTLGFTMIAAVAFFSFVGYKIDQKTHNEFQLWTLLGIFTGLTFSGYEVWKLIKREQEEEKKNGKTKKSR